MSTVVSCISRSFKCTGNFIFLSANNDIHTILCSYLLNGVLGHKSNNERTLHA